VTIDLRAKAGQELITQLITAPGPDAGMFLTNFPARGWMDYTALAARRPDLIMAVVTGNHDDSSAVDYTVNPATGFPWATGPRNLAVPFNHLLPAWDAITGTLAATALLAAERHRSRTGQGQRVKVALSDVAFAMVGNLGKIAEVTINRDERHKDGNYLYGAFGRDFRTKDGRRIMVVALTLRQWQSLVEATGLAEAFEALEGVLGVDLDLEGERYKARDSLGALVRHWTTDHTFAEIRELFDAHGVCWGVYQTFTELVDEDPRCSTANPMFEEVDQPGIGRYLMPGSPLDFSDVDRLPVRPAPALGEHTDEVLTDLLGLTGAELGRLHDDGIIAGPDEQP